MSENTAEKQRISPLISLLLEFLDISRTCMHDHNSYLDPVLHFTSAGIGSPAETRTRVHLHVRSVADILLAIMYATIPFRSREKLTQWRSTTNVRSWTVLPRINKVLHTDSLVCRIDWCQTRNKTRHYCWNFWQKAFRIVLQLAICRNGEFILHRPRSKQKRTVIILLKQLPL